MLAPLVYVALVLGVDQLPEDDGGAWSILYLLMLLAALAIPAVLVVLALIQLYRLFRSWRNAKGHYTKSEEAALHRRAAAELDEAENRAMPARAQAFRRVLLEGGRPESVRLMDTPLEDGEECFLIDTCRYARYYGMDVTVTQSSPIVIGRPAFMLGALAGSVIGNSRARSRAEQEAAAQWREWQDLEVRVTDRRIMCRTAARGWLSFHHQGVSAIHPDMDSATLVLEFPDTEPLMLSGRIIPQAAHLVVLARMGVETMRDHPELQKVDQWKVKS